MNKEYKPGDIVKIKDFHYVLGESVNLNGNNLKIGEKYIEHTQIDPDRFEIYKKEYDDEFWENSWKISEIRIQL